MGRFLKVLAVAAIVCCASVQVYGGLIFARRGIFNAPQQYSQHSVPQQKPKAQTPPSAQLGERVYTLPEDGNQLQVSLFTHDDWRNRPAERNLVQAFETDPELLRLRQGTNFRHITTTDRAYAKFEPALGGVVPAVAMQTNPGGDVLYKASGANVPPPEQLLGSFRTAIAEKFRKHCPNCPRQDAKPAEEPAESLPVAIPDVLVAKPADEESNGDVGLWVVTGLFSLCVGGFFMYRYTGSTP